MSRLAVLIVEAVVDFIVTGGAVLTGYMTANGAVVMPSRGAIVLTIIGGLVGAANQVRGRLKDLPLTVLALTLGTAMLSGCSMLPLNIEKMSAEQIREFAKIKDANIMCIKMNTPYGNATGVYLNVDKGVVPNGTVSVDDSCKATVTNATPKP